MLAAMQRCSRSYLKALVVGSLSLCSCALQLQLIMRCSKSMKIANTPEVFVCAFVVFSWQTLCIRYFISSQAWPILKDKFRRKHWHTQ